MSRAVQRNGEWWHQRDDGSWLKWSAPESVWVADAAPPPPPPPTPAATFSAPVATAPVPVAAAAGAYYGRPVAETTYGPANDYFIQERATTFPSPLAGSATSAGGAWFKIWVQIGVAIAVAAALGFVFMRFVAGPSAPSEEEVAAAFAPLQGYTYQEVPEAILDQGRDQIALFAEGEEFTLGAKGVTAGAAPVGAVLIIGVEPEEISASSAEEVVGGFEQGSGMTLREVPLGSTTGYAASSPQGAGLFFLDNDGFVFFVMADNGNRALDIASQLERANR